MAILAREIETFNNAQQPRRRGRPRELRTIVADQGYVVVDATREALIHIGSAIQIDRHCDSHMTELHGMLHRLETAAQMGDMATIAAIAQAAGPVMDEIVQLDALEETQWRSEASGHVGEARVAGREIITMLDRPEPALMA